MVRKQFPRINFHQGISTKTHYTTQNQDCTLYFVLSVTIFIYNSRFVNGCIWKLPPGAQVALDWVSGGPSETLRGLQMQPFLWWALETLFFFTEMGPRTTAAPAQQANYKYLEPKDDILNVFARTRAIENMKPRFLRWWQAICISDSLSPPALFRHRTTFPRDTVLFIIARRVQGN